MKGYGIKKLRLNNIVCEYFIYKVFICIKYVITKKKYTNKNTKTT